jgi:hypothetical protein
MHERWRGRDIERSGRMAAIFPPEDALPNPRLTSKYGRIAVEAAARCRSGDAAEAAWKSAAAVVFPDQPASRSKGCPKCAFEGLVEAGRIVGVSRSSDLPPRTHNAEYAVTAADILAATPGRKYTPPALWREVMAGEEKRHNGQMDVVLALWENGDLA